MARIGNCFRTLYEDALRYDNYSPYSFSQIRWQDFIGNKRIEPIGKESYFYKL